MIEAGSHNINMWKGLMAGFAGGLAGAWAMGQVHRTIASRPAQGEDSTEKAARAVAQPFLHRKLNAAEARVAGPLVHYAFGSSLAAAYGLAAERAPAITRGAGLPFGSAVWLGAHVIMVPLLGLSPPAMQSSASSEIAEFTAHLVYGGVTELARRGTRRLLGR